MKKINILNLLKETKEDLKNNDSAIFEIKGKNESHISKMNKLEIVLNILKLFEQYDVTKIEIICKEK